MLSYRLLRHGRAPAEARAWRASARHRLRDRPASAGVAVLRAVAGECDSVGAAIVRLAAMIGEPLHPPCPAGSACRAVRGRAPDVAAGAPRSALAAYHRAVIAPYLPGFVAAVDAERAELRFLAAHGGPGAMLRHLGAVAPWADPDAAPAGIGAVGHGAAVIPSIFCDVPFWLPERPHGTGVLVYPISASARSIAFRPYASASALTSLQRLLGRTRAAILCGLREPHTTSQVARRSRISVPSASRHLSVLRDAGLVHSRRRMNEVHHALTSLGEVLTRPASGTRP